LSKKHLHFYEAEKMFVHENLTSAEIAARLKLSEKTIRAWRNEGGWVEKRNQYLRKDVAFHEELYEFSRKLMRTINSDIENGQKTNTGQLYTFSKILSLITKVKEYEDVVAKKDKRRKKGLSPEIIRQIEEEILGIKHNDSSEEENEPE